MIPDHSSVGAYSNSLEALLYKQTAQHVPNMIMMSAFGGPEIAETMRHFMGHLEMAEHALSKEDRSVLDLVHPKDKGPFLYWLTHERESVSCEPHWHGLFRMPFRMCPADRDALLRLDRTLSKASDDQRQVLGTLLADLKQADYSKINASLQGSRGIKGIRYKTAQEGGVIAES